MTIAITFDTSIFNSAFGLDVVASGYAYSAALLEALTGEYPGSDISVTFDPTTNGASSRYTAVDEYGEANDEAEHNIFQISNEVFNENPYWQIEEATA